MASRQVGFCPRSNAAFEIARVVPRLVQALAAIDYPPDKLDIKLIVEADDESVMVGFQEKPRRPRSCLANAGIYAFAPALLDVAGFTPGAAPPNARQVAFQIAPRLNAAGRMDTARAVVELALAG